MNARASRRLEALRVVQLGERRRPSSRAEQQLAELEVAVAVVGRDLDQPAVRARRVVEIAEAPRRCRPRTGSSRSRRWMARSIASHSADRERGARAPIAAIAPAAAAPRVIASVPAIATQATTTTRRVVEPRDARTRGRARSRRATTTSAIAPSTSRRRDRERAQRSCARPATSARRATTHDAIGDDEHVERDHQPREQADLEAAAARCRCGTRCRAAPRSATSRGCQTVDRERRARCTSTSSRRGVHADRARRSSGASRPCDLAATACGRRATPAFIFEIAAHR